MDESSSTWLIGIGAGVLVVRTLLGAADSSLVLISRSRVRQAAEEGHGGSKRLEGILDDRHRLHASLAACRTTLSMLLGAITTWLAVLHMPDNVSGQISILLVTVVGTLFLELAARRLAWVNPEGLGVALVPFYVLVHRIASPFVEVFSGLAGAVTRVGAPAGQATPEREVTEDDIRLMVDVGRDLEESEKEMIHSIFELGETLAREVMVPRVDMVAVELNAPLERVLDLCLERGYSRIPVYEGTVDTVVGMVAAKDLLQLMKDQQMDKPLKDVLRPAYFVPGSKKVDELLREMQRDRVSAAIVVDEYGGTDGMVTMEDLIEEIVGEITDEYDKETPSVEALEDGAVLVDAKMIIEDVNDLLDIEIPADEYETIGGYVYGLLGHVPRARESTNVDGLIITVEEVQRQRIRRLRIEREDKQPLMDKPDASRASVAGS